MKQKQRGISLPAVMTGLVSAIVAAVLGLALLVFLSVYIRTTVQMAMTNSQQSVVQVANTVEDYVEDMKQVMNSISASYKKTLEERKSTIDTIMKLRSYVVAVYCYDERGMLLEDWTGSVPMKMRPMRNLSIEEKDWNSDETIHISKPHVESMLENYYPWVVSMMQYVDNHDGQKRLVVMDIRFSKIARYVGNVGIGQHGYCFITNENGDIVYHPQQQLLYTGLKSEDTGWFSSLEDGVFHRGDQIYAIQTDENTGWRIVGVSYLDEVVNQQVQTAVRILTMLLAAVLFTAVVSSILLSRVVSRPIHGLVKAMQDFEKNAEAFSYTPEGGTKEVVELSQSFEHMVGQIQELMSQVRNEEITLRKTELKALQAQINPHFLYNTLDAIGWMCEEERSKEAVEMVNALARLFRISISRGHELIPIEKEVEHARSYLKIQKFRYKDQFEYEFQVDESCLGYYCNKITLQPIIENAIYHGIDRMVDQGFITIRIFPDGEDIVFQVEDNGIGMTEEQCSQFLKQEGSDRQGLGGIGIKNVNDRIKIYFGEKYGISIESELDEGTCVTIRMPKVKGDEV